MDPNPQMAVIVTLVPLFLLGSIIFVSAYLTDNRSGKLRWWIIPLTSIAFFIAVHLLVFSTHYLPWLSSRVERFFKE